LDQYSSIIEKTALYDVLADTRVVKSEEELKVLKFIIKVSSEGHIEALKKIRAGNREF